MWKQANVNGYQVYVYLPVPTHACYSNLSEPLCWITYGEYDGGYVSLQERYLSHPSRKKILIPNDVAALIERWIDLQLQMSLGLGLSYSHYRQSPVTPPPPIFPLERLIPEVYEGRRCI
jgi:hypothetical protein